MSTEQQLEKLNNTLRAHAEQFPGEVDPVTVEIYLEDLSLRTKVPKLQAEVDSHKDLVDQHNDFVKQRLEVKLQEAKLKLADLEQLASKIADTPEIDPETQRKHIQAFLGYLSQTNDKQHADIQRSVATNRVLQQQCTSFLEQQLPALKEAVENYKKQDEELQRIEREIDSYRASPIAEPNE